MAPRRVSTIIGWLKSLDIIRENRDGLLVLQPLTLVEAEPLEFSDKEPLLPKATTLKEYETVAERFQGASGTVSMFRDQARLDRANAEHQRLVKLVAARLRRTGAIPKTNQFVDLAALTGDRACIFEMKSINRENARPQIRNGVSQLYEYRYLQAMPEATLVLVTSVALPPAERWMQEYLETDRQIRLVWDGKSQLYASAETRRDLAFLW